MHLRLPLSRCVPTVVSPLRVRTKIRGVELDGAEPAGSRVLAPQIRIIGLAMRARTQLACCILIVTALPQNSALRSLTFATRCGFLT